jgi:N-acetylglucosaminyldiphosphoundecaprenol N-acetyl-beta-D-mannosaminyltransferase
LIDTGKIQIGPLPIDIITRDDLVQVVVSSALHAQSLTVCTPNLQFYGSLRKVHPEENMCHAFDYVVADGWPIAVAATLKRRRILKRITGSDLLPILLEITKNLNIRVLIVGGHEKDSDSIESKLCSFPQVEVATPPQKTNIDELFKIVTTRFQGFSGATLIVLCLGFPLSEETALLLKNHIKSPILCLGASLDFYVGLKKRAPKIFRISGLEWFWRLIQEPKRLWRRYLLVSIPSLFSLMKEILKS